MPLVCAFKSRLRRSRLHGVMQQIW